MLFGVYISGPGIVGRLLVHLGDGNEVLLFASEAKAEEMARAFQTVRPYHLVEARRYVEGDETRGDYARHPDGYS